MSTLEQDVSLHVANKIAKGESFTAFDVTTELGAARHRYVKPIVHQLFTDGEMTGYKQEADRSISGSPLRYSPAVVTTVSPTAPVTQSPAVVNNLTEEVSLNEDGTRLRVRKATVQSAGFKSGDLVHAGHIGGKIYITASPQHASAGQTILDVAVDVKQNVRLNVSKLGVQGTQFKADVSKGLIVVDVS